MIQIQLIAPDGKIHSLELAPETTIAMEMLSPYFDTELSEGAFSYPLTIPFSELNRRLLGAPELLEALPVQDYPFWTVDVKDDGIPELDGVKLTLLGHQGDFQYRSGSYTMTISGQESLFGSLIRGKSLKDLKLGGPISMGVYDPRLFASNLMKGQFPQYHYISFAPIYWPGFIDESREDHDGEFLAGDMVNDILYQTPNWSFARNHNGAPALDGTPEYRDYRTIPFLQLHYVLRCIFQEHGYEPQGAFLDDADYRKLFLFNNFAINRYSPGNADLTRRIDPRDHVPDISVAAFMKALCLTFNLSIHFLPGKRVELRYNTITGMPVTNLTDRAVDAYHADEKPPVATGGLKMAWGWDEKDEAVADFVKDIDPARVRASVQLATAIPSLQLSPQQQDGDLIYVISENYYYRFNFQAQNWQQQNIGDWVPYSEGQQPKLIGEGKEEQETLFSPLCERYGTNVWGNYSALDFLTVRQKGSYYNNAGHLVSNEFGLRLFYVDRYDKWDQAQQLQAGLVPTAFCHSHDQVYMTRRVRTSLSWTAPDGLYNHHWRQWIELLQKSWYVRASFDLGPGERDLLSWDRIVQIRNVQYLVERKAPVLGSTGVWEARLIKI